MYRTKHCHTHIFVRTSGKTTTVTDEKIQKQFIFQYILTEMTKKKNLQQYSNFQ